MSIEQNQKIAAESCDNDRTSFKFSDLKQKFNSLGKNDLDRPNEMKKSYQAPVVINKIKPNENFENVFRILKENNENNLVNKFKTSVVKESPSTPEDQHLFIDTTELKSAIKAELLKKTLKLEPNDKIEEPNDIDTSETESISYQDAIKESQSSTKTLINEETIVTLHECCARNESIPCMYDLTSKELVDDFLANEKNNEDDSTEPSEKNYDNTNSSNSSLPQSTGTISSIETSSGTKNEDSSRMLYTSEQINMLLNSEEALSLACNYQCDDTWLKKGCRKLFSFLKATDNENRNLILRGIELFGDSFLNILLWKADNEQNFWINMAQNHISSLNQLTNELKLDLEIIINEIQEANRSNRVPS